ncbi:hypothetical protein GLYMA_10G214750v4 [Glycine max]|nr:hypothetical protein GLYMA_10G214750v4 [Glycine max]KAH1139434.1 hypothetical protein GYH30_028708 [Glycine max]
MRLFLRLFIVSLDQDVTVLQMGFWEEGRRNWKP